MEHTVILPRGSSSCCRYIDQALLLAIILRAEPLCIARWSVLSLWIKYCGSSFEAWTVYPLNVISEITFFLTVPRTLPASEFHSTWSPGLKSCVIAQYFRAYQLVMCYTSFPVQKCHSLYQAADRSSNDAQHWGQIGSQPDQNYSDDTQHQRCRWRAARNRRMNTIAGGRLLV